MNKLLTVVLTSALLSAAISNANAGQWLSEDEGKSWSYQKYNTDLKGNECLQTVVMGANTLFTKEASQARDGSSTNLGSSIAYVNGGVQNSYEAIPQMQESRVGDKIEICLSNRFTCGVKGKPKHMVRLYAAKNLRTGNNWMAPDDQDIAECKSVDEKSNDDLKKNECLRTTVMYTGHLFTIEQLKNKYSEGKEPQPSELGSIIRYSNGGLQESYNLELLGSKVGDTVKICLNTIFRCGGGDGYVVRLYEAYNLTSGKSWIAKDDYKAIDCKSTSVFKGPKD